MMRKADKTVVSQLYKTPIQRNLLKRSCKIATSILHDLSDFITPGKTGLEIEAFVLKKIKQTGAHPVKKSISHFPSSISINPGPLAAHGVPGSNPLQEGELVTVDIIIEKGGWYGDAAWTYCVGSSSSLNRELRQMAWQAALAGVKAVQIGRPLRCIGDAIFKEVSKYGYSVLPECGGHGIGQNLHEEPVIHMSAGGSSELIQDGMVFTIEPVIVKGDACFIEYENEYELYTSDYRNTAQFELTVAVNTHGIELLNNPESDYRFCINPPF